jgi:hypothetical protein
MKRRVEKDGADFLIVFTDGVGVPVAREMRELFKGLQIDVVFLDDYLSASDKSVHLPDVFHWNPTGNKIAASAVAHRVKQKLSNGRYKQ